MKIAPIPISAIARPSEPSDMGQASVKLRQGRISVAGHIYLVTFTTAERNPHFKTWETASLAAGLLTEPTSWQRSRLLAWVLMPDHWHGLVQLGDSESLSACIGRLKGSTSRQLKLAHPHLGRVWGPGFHDRAMRSDDDLRATARYLAMNPVRAGLVKRVGDYPYWDAIWV